MPILHRFGSVSVRMYAADHRPPHFHIVAPDFQVLVQISDLVVIAGDARRARSPKLWLGRKAIGRCLPKNGRS